MRGQIEQAANRANKTIPSVEEFIVLRRRTIGGHIVEAMVEYSLDFVIPEHVWVHPVLLELSAAAVDIMTWPNDLCSFNKEQADGDLQNLVFCVMLEQDVDLQDAVDIVTKMVTDRVDDYVSWKKQLPSFGSEVDEELRRYFKALEQYIQGTIVWYYESPRYFRCVDTHNKENLVISVYGHSADPQTLPYTIEH